MAETMSLARKPAPAAHAEGPGRGPRRTTGRLARRVLASGTACLLAVGVLGSAPAALAASAPHWSVVPSPNALAHPQAQLDAVSCTAAKACIAVGSALSRLDVQVPLAGAWNGRRWAVKAVPAPAGARASSLAAVSCTSPARCIAVGRATDSGGNVTPLAEGWNGRKWVVQAVPVPFSGGSLAGVSCMSATACIAVGQAVGTEIPLAEAWNGVTWAIQVIPEPAGDNNGSALAGVSCTSATACIAVGQFTVGENMTPLAEAWNGTTWAIQPVPAPSGMGRPQASILNGVSCTSATACIAVGANGGATLAERWNGTKWALQRTPSTRARLNGVSCTSARACMAVSVSRTERWNGRKWAVQRTASPARALTRALGGVSCVSATRCAAVGSYTSPVPPAVLAAVQKLTLAEGWNGKSWRVQPAHGDPGTTAPNVLTGVSCAAESACIAVGSYDQDGDLSGVRNTLAERWNGSAWARLGTPSPTAVSSLSGVSCSAPRACTAVGSYFTLHRGHLVKSVTLAERWNGRTWAIQRTPRPSRDLESFLSAVSCTSGRACIAVGHREIRRRGTRATVDMPLAERWNGRNWAVMAIPDSSPSAEASLAGVSCTSARSCEAVGSAGNFGSGGSVLTLAERWNGRKWSIQRTVSPSGGSFTSAVFSAVSCTTATACTAVGQYVDAARVTRGLAERWNGTSWAVQSVPRAVAAGENVLTAVSCTSAAACTAVGYSSPGPGVVALAKRWNGAEWAIQSIPDPRVPGAVGNNVNLSGLSCTSGRVCAAVGSYENGGRTLAERFS
jgi:hypothetical protein